MAGQQENYAAFNSRALVEMVGDVTDEALKATKIKQFLSVLAGLHPPLGHQVLRHRNGRCCNASI